MIKLIHVREMFIALAISALAPRGRSLKYSCSVIRLPYVMTHYNTKKYFAQMLVMQNYMMYIVVIKRKVKQWKKT